MRTEQLDHLITRFKGTKTAMIIGAGLSNEVAGVPLGVELALQFARDMGYENSPALEKGMTDLEHRFPYYIRDDFKTIAFALHSLDRAALKEAALKHLCIPPMKSDLYASINSLVQKGAIETVVNFNFDELLEYNSLIPIVRDSGDAYDTPTMPLHIKMHGTISRPEYLRFLRPDWHRLEERIELILKDRLRATQTIVVAGFRLNFPPFIKLIQDAAPKDFALYVIDKRAGTIHESICVSDWIKVEESYAKTFQYLDQSFTRKGN